MGFHFPVGCRLDVEGPRARRTSWAAVQPLSMSQGWVMGGKKVMPTQRRGRQGQPVVGAGGGENGLTVSRPGFQCQLSPEGSHGIPANAEQPQMPSL